MLSKESITLYCIQITFCSYQWYCHSDDDVYVNVPLLSQLLQQYDAHKPYYFGRLSTTRGDLSPKKEVIVSEIITT